MRSLRVFLSLTTLIISFGASSSLLAQAAWTVGTTNLSGSNELSSVAYGNGHFVATSIFGRQPGVIWSRDGLTWSRANTVVPLAISVIFAGGSFYTLGSQTLWRSADGIEWEQIHTPLQAIPASSFNLMASDGTSMLLTTGTNDAMLEFSPDLRTWRRTASLPNAAGMAYFQVLALTQFRGRYFALYYAGATAGGSPYYAAVTTDGTSWSSISVLAGANTMAATEERLVALKGFQTVTSTDGTTFTVLPSDTRIMNTQFRHAGGRIFSLQTLLSTRDGATWSALGSHTFPTDGSLALIDAAFGNGRYVVVGTTAGSAGTLSFTDAVRTIAGSGAPTFAQPPTLNRVLEAQAVTLSAVLDIVEPGTTYRWFHDGILLPGATGSTLTLATAKSADVGRYAVEARNAFGTTTADVALVTLAPPATAPTIASGPVSVTRVAGQSASFSVVAGGTPPFTYQWRRNGSPIPGATASTFVLDTPLLSDASDYTVTITNAAGSVTSAAAALTVSPVSRISNLSVLTHLGSADDTFTLGYVLGGGTTNEKSVVIRSVGPSLAALGVAGSLDDPKLDVYAGSAKTGENDNWGGGAGLSSAFSNVGAFPFTGPGSRDAAVVTTLSSRDNSVRISAVGGGTGLVLAEVYDATPAATFSTATPRLLNVSVLKPIGAGLTVGFTVAGGAPKSVVIRAVGPTLGGFGVGNPVADPQLMLYNSASAKIAENDNWGGASALAATFAAIGAFELPPSSKDAALLIPLPPGGYSVQVTGVGNAAGTALVEVYEVP